MTLLDLSERLLSIVKRESRKTPSETACRTLKDTLSSRVAKDSRPLGFSSILEMLQIVSILVVLRRRAVVDVWTASFVRVQRTVRPELYSILQGHALILDQFRPK